MGLGFVFALLIAAPAEQKEWTILVYLNADSNLHRAGFDDIREMESFGSNENLHLVVQFDYQSPSGSKRIYIENNDDQHYPRDPETFLSPVVEAMEEQDMGDIETFIDFVQWGVRRYPSEKLMIVFWNHGSGWSFLPHKTIEKSISYDDSSGNYITTNEIAEAFDRIFEKTNIRPDIVGFDACLMTMMEVADALIGRADYLVGSQETEPFDGWPYDDFLKSFFSRIDRHPERLVKDIVQTYRESYNGGSQGWNFKTTQSALDLNRLQDLKPLFNDWLSAVENDPVLERDLLLEEARRTTAFDDPYYRDLSHYAQRLTNLAIRQESEGPTVALGLRLQAAIEDVVISNYASDRYSEAHGLSIYLPVEPHGRGGPWNQPSGQNRQRAYMNLSFAETSLWPTHLDQLFPWNR